MVGFFLVGHCSWLMVDGRWLMVSTQWFIGLVIVHGVWFIILVFFSDS